MIEVEVRRIPGISAFDVYVSGRWLCTSATPFSESAAALLAEGHSSSEVLVMVDADRVMTMQAPLGYGAALLIPMFVPWRSFLRSSGPRGALRGAL